MERRDPHALIGVAVVLAAAIGAAVLSGQRHPHPLAATSTPLAEPSAGVSLPATSSPAPAPSAAPAPAARSRPGMVWDPVHQVVLLYGGASAKGELADTWTWDGQAWLRKAESSPPGPGGSLAFDAARGQAVLLNGAGTWTWDGGAWTRQHPLHPPPSVGPLAYNPSLGVVVLVAGKAGGDGTWTWNGSDWSRVQGIDANPAGGALVYDARTARLLEIDRATWAFVGLRWSQLGDVPAGMPTIGLAAAYAGSVNRPVAYGGDPAQGGAGDQLWTWDGNSWKAMAAEGRPAGRSLAGLAFDAKRGELLLFGGQGPAGYLGDTWTWKPDAGWTRKEA